MNAIISRTLFAGSAMVVLASAASAAVVTPSNPQGWSAQNVKGTGTVAIDSTYKPAGQQGSLHFTTSGGNDKADFVDTWGVVAGRTLGNISALSYSYLRDAQSTTADYRAPAFRLSFYDAPTGKSGYLIYEPVYQQPGNAPVPTGVWNDKDILGGNFWMREFGGSGTIEKYDVTLAQWASGTQQAPNAYVLNSNTSIYAIEVGVGSGWDGTFVGAADNVNLAFGSDVISANFEPDGTAAVPEPASWAMMVGGFGLVGSALRRRKVTVSFG